MTADVQRELAEALPTALPHTVGCDAHRTDDVALDYDCICFHDRVLPGLLSRLLPTVQALIAVAEKRAAARAAAYAYEQGYDACRHGEQRRNPYRDRAAALDPSGAAEGAGR